MVEVDEGAFNYNLRVPVETSQKNPKDFWIRPTGGVVNQQGPFNFTIEPMTDRYLMLNKIGLEISVKVVRGDMTNCQPWMDIVAPVNLLGVVMWESVQVMLNGHPFNGAAAVNAGIKAYIDTLLTYDTDSGQTHLSTQFYHLDSPNKFGDMRIGYDSLCQAYTDGVQKGAIARQPFDGALQFTPVEQTVYGGRDLEMIGYEDIDVAGAQNRLTAGEIDEGEFKLLSRQAVYQTVFNNTIAPFREDISVDDRSQINLGFQQRYALTSDSEPVDMYVPLNADFFKIDNHIAPGNKIDIKLTRYPDAFLLNTFRQGQNYKLVILDMKLHLRTLERRERIATPMVEKYLMNETQCHRQVVTANTPSVQFRIHYGGVLPKTVILCMSATRAGNGDYSYNPVRFQHFYVRRVALIINGETMPSDGLRVDFESVNPKISRAYRWLYENTGASDSTKGNIISWNAFMGGTTIFPFDLTPDKCNGLHFHDANYGYIDVELDFSRPLNQPIYVYYEMVFPKVVVNDKLSGQVVVLDVESSGGR